MSQKTDYTQQSDEQLVMAVLQDKEVYVYLMQRYERKLFHFLRHITRLSDAEYEDILQNAFLKAYLNLREFDPSLKFSNWMYRIVHNEMIDHVRRNKNQSAHVSLDSEDEDELKLLDILPDGTDLARELDQILLSHEIGKHLQSLPLEYREVITLRFLEEKDYQEISDILKKPMGTVATLLNRAKKKLAEKLKSAAPHLVLSPKP